MPGDAAVDDADAWDRVCMLAETVTVTELLDLPAPTLLRRLFHEEQVRLFKPQQWRFSCKCSRERVASVLRSLGHDELRRILTEENTVDVACEYCSNAFTFDAVDVVQLFSDAASAEPPTATRH